MCAPPCLSCHTCFQSAPQVRGRVDGRPVVLPCTLPPSLLQGAIAPDVADALLLVLRALLASKGPWADALTQLANAAFACLPALLNTLALKAPAVACRLPQLWITFALLAVPDSQPCDVYDVLSLTAQSAEPPLPPGHKLLLCENHQDGTTPGKWACASCGTQPLAALLRGGATGEALSLCDECDQCLHLAPTQRAHHREVIKANMPEVGGDLCRVEGAFVEGMCAVCVGVPVFRSILGC